jgi:hypothetical protein
MQRRIFIGWDPREVDAYAVARHSVLGHMTREIPVHGLFLADLQARGLYRRPTEQRLVSGHSVMWDVLSDAPMSTEHANARFLVPHLAWDGWSLFMDSDMLAMADFAPLFDALDPQFAVYCVKHRHEPPQDTKMDGQAQLRYARKNWTSFMVLNCDHPANQALTVHMVNSLPGRDMHRFCWLDDDQIGELGPEWNYLVGHTSRDLVPSPKVVHFTDGIPSMAGYEDCEYAEAWREELRLWAA